jgi:dTDP-glucose 4,6-dehydratase
MTILVTGGAGFIGSNFVRDWFDHSDETIVNLDKLTYAGRLENLDGLADDPRHVFIRGDIADRALVSGLFAMHRPRAVINLAAESHVDKSINDPSPFIAANIDGTFQLLEATRAYLAGLDAAAGARFRFLHVSTDEVYGSLGPDDQAFRETTPYRPNSPYSASKAAADHLVRAYFHTFGIPAITTNCSNNFGPAQFPEKFIPVVIHSAVGGRPIPVYGNGLNVRDWLYVADHCSALRTVLDAGTPGETYNIGAGCELSNIELAGRICAALDEMRPRADGASYRRQIEMVTDRPGHDFRYAVNSSKLKAELNWQPAEGFDAGLRKTVAWYLARHDAPPAEPEQAAGS